MRSKLFKALLVLGITSAAATAAHAGEIRIVNLDVGTNQGLDDHAPATPVGGNPGTTRGAQALIVFQFAADIWGSVLQSNVPVINTATFTPLSCDATSGVLGSSGTNYVFSFNAPAPAGAVPNVWYHSALTDALGGTDAGVENDLPPDSPDIVSRFNSKLGSTGCLETSGWYFGLDGKTPSGQINFLNVVLHEMAHGLGFSGFNSLATGQQFNNTPDIYSTFVKDNATGKAWTAMTDAERKTAALNDTHLVFTGTQVKTEAPLALTALITFNVTTPVAIAGTYDYNAASFGASPTPANFAGSVVRPASPEACGTVDASVSGKIALIDRGTCAFAIKVKNAQVAGATAVIIANNQAGAISPSGDDASIAIPTIAVTQVVGDTFKANLAGLAVAFTPDPQGRLAGGDAGGNVLLYAPTVLAQGSSFSHYDTRLVPNAIMEYAINPDLVGQIDLDLTPALLKDEGWKLNAGTQKLLTCDTGIPTWVQGGSVIGANVISNLKVQSAAAASLADYRTAALAYAADLASSGLITSGQASSLNACLADTELQKQYDAWGSGGGNPGGPTAIALQNGVALGGQTGTAGGEVVYKLDVPAGARALVLRTFGGTGDVSLYVKAGDVPTTTSYDAQSVHTGNSESVTVARPVAGTYYLKVVGVKAYSGVSVQGNYTAP
ncbi:MAG TPA: PA domain-containing protein [Dyella sp.]|uniref:PA domain-containing protein n=1 Tax=Dyella sp. TaxID=1869338 RepID=UPI002D79E6EC|nr:PA domain-containing protein [Dyella sp.]HET6554849.1 PA domain-containing protein [Dyella sp.]